MTRPHSVFDILGPVMIGPSSSHTAGAVRLGALARAVFGEQPSAVRITLHGSFASTGHGHGTDIALVAGLLGMRPDDPAIRDAFRLADEAGMRASVEAGDLGDAHPNTARIEMTRDERSLVVQGSSIGGAEVVLTRIGEFDVEADGHLPLLLVAHHDRPGEIAAVTSTLAENGVNVAAMRVSRTRRGADALMLIETDAPVDDATAERIAEAPGVTFVRRVPAV